MVIGRISMLPTGNKYYNKMFKFYIFNQPTYSAKRALGFFTRHPREGCRVEIEPYNNMWCNVTISLHPNFAYSVILNYISNNKNSLKCSQKAKDFVNSISSTYRL